jgi:hypothetical protein
MTHGEQADPEPGRWYKTVIDWPYEGCVVWARIYPWFSPPFKSTWSLSYGRFYHASLPFYANWSAVDSWRLYDGP